MNAPPHEGAAATVAAARGAGALYDPDCLCCRLLGRKWAPQIVAVLLSGPHRFSALHAAVPGISEKVLSSRLSEFEAMGMVTREQYAEIPTRVEYALTEAGLALEPVIGEMARWSEKFPVASGSDSCR